MSTVTLNTESPITPERLVTAPELADYLGVHENWVYAMAKANSIPSLKVGRLRRFQLEAVLAALQA